MNVSRISRFARRCYRLLRLLESANLFDITSQHQQMKSKIEALATYYRQFHHALMGWQITLSGFVFAALLAASIACS
jgi:hypothetical protein